jgi:hypothetical protein
MALTSLNGKSYFGRKVKKVVLRVDIGVTAVTAVTHGHGHGRESRS